MKQREPSANWRCFKEIEINNSMASTDWVCDGKAYRELYLCPHGMVKTLTEFVAIKNDPHWSYQDDT